MKPFISTSSTGLLVADESAPCIVCGARDWAPHFRLLKKCSHCSFIRAQELLSEDEIKKLYEEDYFRGKEYGDYLADRDVHVKNFAYRLEEVFELTGGMESLYEIGSAYGLWLEQVAAKGVRCAGIDVCQAAVDHAANKLGLDVRCGDFLQQDIAPGEYQVFCMWDTVEHLAHPEEFLERVHALLPPEGWFFLTTGNIGSSVARRRGPRWRMIHPPTHLQYFSSQTMTRLLERLGYRVVITRSIPMYRNLRSVLTAMLALSKGLPKKAAWLAEKVTPLCCQKALGGWLNLGDIMFVAARKPRRMY